MISHLILLLLLLLHRNNSDPLPVKQHSNVVNRIAPLSQAVTSTIYQHRLICQQQGSERNITTTTEIDYNRRNLFITRFFHQVYQLLSKIINYIRIICGLDPNHYQGMNHIIDENLHWDGIPASIKEKENVNILRKYLMNRKIQTKSNWIRSATDVELLRFLRACHGHVDEAWIMIKKHIQWRTSCYGAETMTSPKQFANSLLHNEMFWLGPNRYGVPTLVVRTQVHDGDIYHDDPKEYCKFLVHMLEKGRRLYGCGVTCQMNLLLDRGGLITRNGRTLHENTSRDVIPHLFSLIKYLFITMRDNYPDMLGTATVVPASWFFRLCYKITSRVLDARSRTKFDIIGGPNAKQHMRKLFPAELLPAHLGGCSTTYLSSLEINYTTK